MSKMGEYFMEKMDEHDLFIEEENYQACLAGDPAYEAWLEEMDKNIREEIENEQHTGDNPSKA